MTVCLTLLRARAPQVLGQAAADDAHPWRKFTWGNLASLRDEPAARSAAAAAGSAGSGGGGDAPPPPAVEASAALDALRPWFDAGYVAGSMRLAVLGAEPLDELEKMVAEVGMTWRVRIRSLQHYE